MVIVHRQGFILSRDIENACIETELSLIDTDWVTSRIIQQDIPILEEAPKSEDNSKVEAHRNENFQWKLYGLQMRLLQYNIPAERVPASYYGK